MIDPTLIRSASYLSKYIRTIRKYYSKISVFKAYLIVWCIKYPLFKSKLSSFTNLEVVRLATINLNFALALSKYVNLKLKLSQRNEFEFRFFKVNEFEFHFFEANKLEFEFRFFKTNEFEFKKLKIMNASNPKSSNI